LLLNCGAISCPPIFVYEFEQLDKQLNSATDSFIEAETTINADSKTISTSSFSYGIKVILAQIKILKY
jgi:hypothetical protein